MGVGREMKQEVRVSQSFQPLPGYQFSRDGMNRLCPQKRASTFAKGIVPGPDQASQVAWWSLV